MALFVHGGLMESLGQKVSMIMVKLLACGVVGMRQENCKEKSGLRTVKKLEVDIWTSRAVKHENLKYC